MIKEMLGTVTSSMNISRKIFFFFFIPFPLLFLSLLCYSFMVVVAGGGDEI